MFAVAKFIVHVLCRQNFVLWPGLFCFQGREEYDDDDGGEEQEDEYEDKRK